VAGIDRINADYAHHCRAARSLAQEYFDAPRVMERLLQRVGVSA